MQISPLKNALVTLSDEVPGTYRVVAVNPTDDDVWIVRMYDEGTCIRKLPLSWLGNELHSPAGTATVATIEKNDPQSIRAAEDKDCKTLQERWAVLEPFTDDMTIAEFLNRKSRRPLCRKIAEESLRRCERSRGRRCGQAPVTEQGEEPPHYTERYVCRLLTQYLQGGMVKEALAPRFDHCGRPKSGSISPVKRGRHRRAADVGPGRALTADDKQKIIDAIAHDFLVPNGKMERSAMEAVVRKLCPGIPFDVNTGYTWANSGQPQCVSYDQIRYYMRRHIAADVILRKRLGNRRANNEIGTQTGADHGVHPLGLGAQYAVDATLMNWKVMSGDPTQPAEPYWLYFVVDVATSMIVGWHICKTHTVEDLYVALYHAFSSKVALARAYGCPLQDDYLDVVGVPEQLLADRGEPFAQDTERIARMLRRMGVFLNLENAPAYSGYRKGWVESDFRYLKDFMRNTQVPGLNPAGPFEEPRAALEPCLTLTQACAITADYVLFHNSRPLRMRKFPPEMIKDGVRSTPEGIAQWNCANYLDARQVAEQNTLRRLLLPMTTADVTRRGIEWGDKIYVPATSRNPVSKQPAPDAKIMKMTQLSAAHIPQHITLYYDPIDISCVYADVEGHPDLVPCISADCSLLQSPTPLLEYEQTRRDEQSLVARNERRDGAYREQLNEHIKSIIQTGHRSARAAGRLKPSRRLPVDDAVALGAPAPSGVTDEPRRDSREEALDSEPEESSDNE
ncbi:MAG: hypothetical protein ACYDH4_05370 [Candidatus Cryosericum sp.]